ncbi:MAG TPA: hypothetical protein VG672_27080 [Bryobacteraceae bacterium]|nr:hypothetical protein [Bryobacteraceae bacterium]
MQPSEMREILSMAIDKLGIHPIDPQDDDLFSGNGGVAATTPRGAQKRCQKAA